MKLRTFIFGRFGRKLRAVVGKGAQVRFKDARTKKTLFTMSKTKYAKWNKIQDKVFRQHRQLKKVSAELDMGYRAERPKLVVKRNMRLGKLKDEFLIPRAKRGKAKHNIIMKLAKAELRERKNDILTALEEKKDDSLQAGSTEEHRVSQLLDDMEANPNIYIKEIYNQRIKKLGI